MQRIAMPSPTGTNYERLYLNPVAALDAAPEEPPAEAKRGDLLRLLKTMAKMSPESWAQLQRDLQGEAAEDDNLLQREMESMGNDPAMDSRSFDRLSTPRRTAAEKSFAKMFPEAMRVKAGSERARW